MRIEKYLFPTVWGACEQHLRQCASLPGRHAITVKSQNQPRTARFVYHLAKHIQTEGYFHVVFPEFEQQEQHLVSANSGPGAADKPSLAIVSGHAPKLLVYLSEKL